MLPGAATRAGFTRAPIDKLSVAFVIVLAFLFLGEAPTWRVLLGVCCWACAVGRVLLGGGMVVAGAVILAVR